MAREGYQDRLTELRGDVVTMAGVALDQYEAAVEVLDSGDPAEAQRVIGDDQVLNDWYLDIESDCVELIALQQPVATDLRFIASSFKVVTDLERVGDLATNLARYGRDVGAEPLSPVEVGPIATEAGAMVEDAMDAYATEDPDAAREVAARDDDLDDQCRAASEAVVRELLTTTDPGMGMDPGDVESTLAGVSHALLTIRDLERVGDHAVNICARTLYMVENDDALIY